MESVVNIVSFLLLTFGSVLCVVSAIGVVRFPDFYTRCHAAGITDSGGAFFILTGCLLQAGLALNWLVAVKLITILIFLWVSSVATTHALAKSAYARGVKAEED